MMATRVGQFQQQREVVRDEDDGELQLLTQPQRSR